MIRPPHNDGLASTPTLLISMQNGDSPVHIVGLLWLIAALAFSVAAAGVALGRAWWRRLTAFAALLSLVLCLAWWSSASSGAVIDVVILAGLFISATGGHHTRLQHSR